MAMTDAARQARNEYARKWRKNNPEKNKVIQENYWKRKAEALLSGKATEKA